MAAAEKCAERFSPPHAEHVRILTRDLRKSVDQLADLRDAGHGSSPRVYIQLNKIQMCIVDTFTFLLIKLFWFLIRPWN